MSTNKIELKVVLSTKGDIVDKEYVRLQVKRALLNHIDNVGVTSDDDEGFVTHVKVIEGVEV